MDVMVLMPHSYPAFSPGFPGEVAFTIVSGSAYSNKTVSQIKSHIMCKACCGAISYMLKSG